MRFRHELSYDVPPDQVFAMLADPEFRRASAQAQEVISADVQLEPAGEGFTLVVDQQQNTKDLPSFARTFAGESTHAIQRETWSGPSGGTLEIATPGKPATIKGTIRLEEDGSGTREVVELEIKVRLPIIGGKIEKLLSEKVAAGMDAERAAGVAWLRDR